MTPFVCGRPTTTGRTLCEQLHFGVAWPLKKGAKPKGIMELQGSQMRLVANVTLRQGAEWGDAVRRIN